MTHEHHSLFCDKQVRLAHGVQVCSGEVFYLSHNIEILAINFAIIFQPLMVNVVSSYPQTADEPWGSFIKHHSV